MVLGIDVAKAKFDVTLQWPEGRRRRKAFPNTPAGFAALRGWLQGHGVSVVHACLEATGTYADALATDLVDHGHVVSLLNPAVTHHYAQSRLARTKTDRVDADLLAEYAVREQPAPWTPTPRPQRELQALVRRLDALQTMRTEEVNRQQAGPPSAVVAASLDDVIAALEAQIQAVRAAIREHIDRHPDLRVQHDLLTSIPGIGSATAATLLAELFHKRFDSARQAAAFSGLIPRVHESGTLRGRTRLSKTGSPRLRKALYWPAISARRHNPTIRAWERQMRTPGKPPLVIIAAVMRKLIHIAFGVLKTQQPYQPIQA